MKTLRHLWLDFSDTIALIDKKELGTIVYRAYAEHVGKEVTPELIQEYKELLNQHKSNSAIFASLGLSSGFMANLAATANQATLYQLTDKNIPEVIQQLRELVPVSIFSNNRLNTLLPALGLELDWFANILGPDVVKSPKPNLEGFYKMIELSGVPVDEILYIGDDVDKDIIPAKKAGIRAGLLWKSSAEADYSFADFQAILALVKMVNKVQ